MRILITGSTAMQVDSPRKVNHLISNLESLKTCIEALGHSVEWREVGLGEDLSEFDACFVSLCPFSSWGTRYMGGALWTIMRHPRVILTADDWQVRGIHSSMNALWKRYDYFEKTIWSHWDKKFGEPNDMSDDLRARYKHLLRQGIRYLAYPEWQHDMLVPCWEGGDLSRLRLPARRLIAYDPSPFMQRYGIEVDTEIIRHREDRWIFASLTAKDSWLLKHRFTWPVEKYGNVRQGQQKLHEHDLMQVYAESWGILSPPHDVSRAGWFRVRFHMARDAGAVLVGGDDDAFVLGPAYRYKPHEIESMDRGAREYVWSQQGNALALKSWDHARMMEVVRDAIDQS